MVKAIRVHELGGAEVLKWEDVEVPEPGAGEILVKHKAIGVNFIDIYFRKGVYKAEKLPFIPGREAVGVVTAVGPGLTGKKVGDLVAYAGNPMGSYAEEQILPASQAVPFPSTIDPIVGAAVMLKGMTVQFLLRSCFKLGEWDLCYANGAKPLVQLSLAPYRMKRRQRKQLKTDAIILLSIPKENFVERVKEITKGQGVHVVYDSVGKDTFQGSLECLASRGYMVSFGQSSGMVDPFPISVLASKSLFLTRPSLMQYTATREELLRCAGEVFSAVANGVIKVRVTKTYPLSEAAKAHADLEARKTTGSIVLIPDSS